jgi:ComF family protein
LVNNWLKLIQSALLPGHCLLCGDWQDADEGLCRACHASLPWLENACRQCGVPLSGEARVQICGQCLRHPPSFQRTVSVFYYQPPVDFLVQRFKFSGKLNVGRLLGGIMAQHLAQRSAPQVDLLMPVPLHARRLRERGFNQAVELARPIARHLQVPLDTHSCRRTRPTAPQSGLPAEQRNSNVNNAFQLSGTFDGMHVALIDDVLTTGSTAAEIARLLLAQGASQVSVWTCARTAMPRT